jgi:hypothetical protein
MVNSWYHVVSGIYTRTSHKVSWYFNPSYTNVALVATATFVQFPLDFVDIARVFKLIATVVTMNLVPLPPLRRSKRLRERAKLECQRLPPPVKFGYYQVYQRNGSGPIGRSSRLIALRKAAGSCRQCNTHDSDEHKRCWFLYSAHPGDFCWSYTGLPCTWSQNPYLFTGVLGTS